MSFNKGIMCIVALCFMGNSILQAKGERKIYAVIIGSNVSADRENPPLHYADDDAIKYYNLFSLVTDKVYLFTTLDNESRRIYKNRYPALQPTKKALIQTLKKIEREIGYLRKADIETVFYFIYSGHGGVKNHLGYISLNREAFTREDLETYVLKGIQAHTKHIIIDACKSYFMVFEKGPGGIRKPVYTNFIPLDSYKKRYQNTGFFLSTSSFNNSHEWGEYQAGIFSHEVMSGLMGPADINADNKISYKELYYFVRAANYSIENEKYIPNTFVLPPVTGDPNIFYLPPSGSYLKVDKGVVGHYFLEDVYGVRHVDFNNSPEQSLKILLKPGKRYFLRRNDYTVEYPFVSTAKLTLVSKLDSRVSKVRFKGAEHFAFKKLFSIPYDNSFYHRLLKEESKPVILYQSSLPRRQQLQKIGYSFIGGGVFFVLSGVTSYLLAQKYRSDGKDQQYQRDVSALNQKIDLCNKLEIASFVIGGAVLTAGLSIILYTVVKKYKPNQVKIQLSNSTPGTVGLKYSF